MAAEPLALTSASATYRAFADPSAPGAAPRLPPHIVKLLKRGPAASPTADAASAAAAHVLARRQRAAAQHLWGQYPQVRKYYMSIVENHGRG